MVRRTLLSLKAERGIRCLRFGDIRIEVENIRAFCCGQVLEMGLREFRLLSFFVENPSVAHSRAVLVGAVWPEGTRIRLSTVDTYVLRLRTALRRVCDRELIHTVRSKGYELNELQRSNNVDAQ